MHRGMLDFVDLLWFVAIGSWTGSFGSYWFGHRVAAGGGGKHRFDPSGSATFGKALSLSRRHGALAVLPGRFTGPVAGLVPFAAGLSGKTRGRWLGISAMGAVPYAVAHVAYGYGASGVFARPGPALAREAVALVALLLAPGLVCSVLIRMIALLPWIGAVLAAALRAIAADPPVARRCAAHRRLTAAVSARLSRIRFGGLPPTLTVAALVAIAALWAGSTVNDLSGDPIIRADRDIASLLHAL